MEMNQQTERLQPIQTLAELSHVITACANRAISIAANNSMSGNYYVGHEYMDDLISPDDYDKYFDLIADEVLSREELLDLEIEGKGQERELNMNIGTDWCKSYVPIPGDGDGPFGIREITTPLSLAEKAHRYDISEIIATHQISESQKETPDHDGNDYENGIHFLTNRYGQSLWDTSMDPWVEAAVDKFIGPKPWVKAPEGFDPLIAEDHGAPVVAYAMGLSLDESKEDLLHCDLDFMNAVANMTAAYLRQEGEWKDCVKFLSFPGGKESESAEIVAVVPASIEEPRLQYAVSRINQLMSVKKAPLHDLTWAEKQYTLVKSYWTNEILTIASRVLAVHPDWIRRSIPEMTSRLCATLIEQYGRPVTNEGLIDPAQLLSDSDYTKILYQTCNKLLDQITLTTYARPDDPNYDTYSDETPTVEFTLPYGALREILAADAQEGEIPLSVEEFLSIYTYDFSEQIRYAYEDMQRKPALDERLKDAEKKKPERSIGKFISSTREEGRD